MPDLTFVTGNPEKFATACRVFAEHGIELAQATFDVDEIQGEDAEKIVTDKLNKAFSLTKAPVIVNDDSWAFAGLGGLPGPYMKSMVHWFSAADFINLTKQLTDKRVTLSQWIGYQDERTQKLFKLEFTGEILSEARGRYGNALQKIISMPGDDGLSVAEAYDKGIDTSKREVAKGWRQFIDWYQDYLKR